MMFFPLLFLVAINSVDERGRKSKDIIILVEVVFQFALAIKYIKNLFIMSQQPYSKESQGNQGQMGQYSNPQQNQQQFYQPQTHSQGQPPVQGNTNTWQQNQQYSSQSNQPNQSLLGSSNNPNQSLPPYQASQSQWQGNQNPPSQPQTLQQLPQTSSHLTSNSGHHGQQNQPVQPQQNTTSQPYTSQGVQNSQYGQQSQPSNNFSQQGNYNQQQGGYNQQQGGYNQSNNYNQPQNYQNPPQGNFNQQGGNLNQPISFQNPQQGQTQQGGQFPNQGNQFNQPPVNQPVEPPKEADSPKKDKDQKKKEEKQKKEKEEKEKKEKKEKEEKQKKEKKEKQEKEKKEKKEKEEKQKKEKNKKPQQAEGKKQGQKLTFQQNVQEEVPKDLTGPQILTFMKKKPYTQKINNIDFTYSVLTKKQQSFLLSNTRFLYLKGIESISYAREFNDKTPLPFTEEAQIPKAKTTYLLTQVEGVTNEQEKLIINFAGEKKVKWEFVCPSKDCSLKWRKKIETAKQTIEEFKSSGISNFDEFVRAKEAKNQFAFNQQQNATNNLMQLNPNPNFNQGNSNFNQGNSNFNQGNSNYNNPNTFNSNLSSHGNQQFNSNLSQNNYRPNNNSSPQHSNYPNQNPNKPNSVLFQGPQAEKIDNFIIDRSPEPKAYLNQSMSRIPVEEKEGIRSDIRRIRRNWIEELLGGQQQVQLLIDFKNYIQRIAQVIVNELYVSQDVKLYPATESTKESATYLIEDVFIEIYFFSEDHLSSKHQRYRSAVQEFKNFEYLINTTKNEGILKVPFMTMFEYKGFLGMAKSNLGENRGYKNREFYDIINRKEFEEITRISAESLLNESKCKIVSYDRHSNNISKYTTQFNKVYFVERLAEFLPLENSKEFGPNPTNVLRAELVNSDELEDQVFRDRVKVIKAEKINGLVEAKIDEFVRVLENEQNYFTSSHQLAELIHLYGINIRYLGVIYKKVKLTWLKRIFQAEIAARCLKNYFRLDMQNSVLQSYDQTNRKERQEERERNKVVSFLNIVFGNTEPTFRLWRNLNSSAIEKYHVKIWDNEFTDVNSGYLLQAIQNHFKIVLAGQVVDRKVFKSTNTFDPRDFLRFDFDFNIYNLDFTNIFDQIHECLEDESLDSFQSLCEILTKETSTRISYLDLLKSHPIHDRISQFLLNFTSPQDNNDLYNKIESKYLPHKFLYESKFAQIKWYLKSNKQDHITRATNFIQEHVRKWLGEVHPLLIQLYRMLAEYFSEMQFYYTRALQYANDSLKLQRTIFEGDSEPIWRDYYLVGKIHFINNRPEDALTYLSKAKALVKPEKLTEYEAYGELCLMLAKGYFGAKYYKESYSTVRELYKTIKEERDERSLTNIVEAVTLIKQLLEINQQHESYYKFVESDFSNIVYAFADHPNLMIQSIKMITIPYLKNVILRNSKNKVRLLNIIEEISKIRQSPNSCQAYIKAKISEGTFPKSYLHCLKEIDSVIDEILANQMIERWKSFNNLANQSILDKIGNSQINRGFDFLANMTALFNLLGQQVLEELFIMEK